MHNAIVDWQGPFTFRQLLGSDENRHRFAHPGVYLWIQKEDGVDTLTYVGTAGGRPHLTERQLQHYMGYIGCSYFIPASFRSGSEWVLEIKSQEVVATIFDREKFIARVRRAFDYVECIQVYLAIPEVHKPADIEANLVYDLAPRDNRRGRNSPPTRRLEIAHRNAQWATPSVRKSFRKGFQLIEA